MKKTLLFLTALLTISASFSQIVHTDINPDTVLQSSNSESYPIDFDNGGTIDLIVFADVQDTTISGFPVTITGVAIQTLNSTQVIGYTQALGNETVVLADTLQNMHLIDGSANYVDNSTPSVYPGVGLGVNGMNNNLGDFQSNGDLSFGVKFDISGNTHYGWVRVDIAAGCSEGTLMEYAYQAIADSSIYAGDTGAGFTSVKENQPEADIKLFNNSFRINAYNNGTVKVVNLIGKTVLSHNINQGTQSTYNLDHLPAGIYLVNFSSKEYTTTKKMWIQK